MASRSKGLDEITPTGPVLHRDLAPFYSGIDIRKGIAEKIAALFSDAGDKSHIGGPLADPVSVS